MNRLARGHGPALWACGLSIAAACGAWAGERDDRGDQSQVKRGYAIVPPGVTLDLHGKNRALVGLGSYIVNSSGCIDCHSHPTYAPGGDPFRGEPEIVNAAQYLSGGRQFGPFTSANLTPDATGKPAGLTLAEFLAIMHTGHDPAGPAAAGHALADLRQEDGARPDRDLRIPARHPVAAGQPEPRALSARSLTSRTGTRASGTSRSRARRA